jgi:hypothetical protein
VREKFAIPTVSSIFDSGDIVIYDVRGLREPPPECSAVGVPSQANGITCRTKGAVLTIAGPNATAELPKMYVRYLHIEIQRRTTGLYVTVLVQVQNVGNASYAPDPDWRHLYLTVDAHRTYRRRSVADRTDNLDGTKPLAPGTAIEGSLTFIVHSPSLIAALLSKGAQLGVRLPSPPAYGNNINVGVIAIAPPAKGSVK